LYANGSGRHEFTLRSDNLTVRQPSRRITLRAGQRGRVTWTARVTNPAAQWVGVVIPDRDVSHRREVIGQLPARALRAGD
jgi:hypothetical protein